MIKVQRWVLTDEQACTQLMALINSLCAMLRSTPFHRENYSRLILSVIIQFYQRCSDRFQDVVSRKNQDLTETRLLISARWAQLENLSSCLGKLIKAVRQSHHNTRILEDISLLLFRTLAIPSMSVYLSRKVKWKCPF